jgi:hypothetical protein
MSLSGNGLRASDVFSRAAVLTNSSSRRLFVSWNVCCGASANIVTRQDGDAWSREYVYQLYTERLIGLDFTHHQSRFRAYRWGEDGIAGVCDTHGRFNIGFSFWNEKE